MIKEISDRQEEIIEVAAKLLTNYGVSGLTIKNIAKEMKFSEGAIYRHFTSKEEIILTMLKFVLRNVDNDYITKSKDLPNATEKLKLLLKNQFLFFQKHSHFAVAIFSDGLLEESKKINEQIALIMATRKKIMKNIIIEGQKQDLFTKEISAEELIHIIMGTVRLQMYKWRISHFEFNIINSSNKTIDSLLKLFVVK